jgi:hypothetical protein
MSGRQILCHGTHKSREAITFAQRPFSDFFYNDFYGLLKKVLGDIGTDAPLPKDAGYAPFIAIEKFCFRLLFARPDSSYEVGPPASVAYHNIIHRNLPGFVQARTCSCLHRVYRPQP